jgi:hypothetical protein
LFSRHASGSTFTLSYREQRDEVLRRVAVVFFGTKEASFKAIRVF